MPFAEIKRKTEKEVSWEYGITFEKLEGSDPDVLYVAGEASNALKDHDNENMDMDSLKSAFVDYMKNPVIKFMHDKAPQHIGAIGLVVEKYIDSAGKLWETKFGKTPFLVAKFEKDTMPDWMWNAIQKRVYKGFSIGGKAFKKVKGTIYVKSWLETSVVDVPSATGAFFTVLKAACTGPDCPYEKGGAGSGVKGHRTAKKKKPSFSSIMGEEAANLFQQLVDENPNEVLQTIEDVDYHIETFQESVDEGWMQPYEEERTLDMIDYLQDFKETILSKTRKSALSTPSLDKFIYDNGETHMKIDKFVESADNFLKGGKGSGQKGHKSSGGWKKGMSPMRGNLDKNRKVELMNAKSAVKRAEKRLNDAIKNEASQSDIDHLQSYLDKQHSHENKLLKK